ncbi:lipopolysaccharide biosynthesis protein [Microbacterium sp. 179-I 3D2 NHS]|uniref:lipopolysaccharide biosynthesis protein n=1 Tax=Microbacterium sp. 179-I 3D2 NHS TaxID=3235178 RepID=UPI0039A11D9E
MPAERLARGGLISLVGSGIAALSSLLLTVLVGQVLGASGTGIFFQALGIFTVLTQVLRLGTNTGIVRFIAEHRAFAREGGEWRIILFAAVPVAVVSAVMSIVVWFASDALARWMSSPDDTDLLAALLRTMAPFIAMSAVLGVVEASARMLRGVAVFTLLQSVMLPLSRLLAVGIFALAGATAWRAFEAWLLPLPLWLVVGAVVIAAPLVRSFRRRSRSIDDDQLTARAFWRFNLPRSVGSALEIALEWADVLIVAAVASPSVAGVYAVVTRVIKAGGIVDQAMRIAVSPTISAMLARSEHVRVSALHTSVVRAMILLSWPFYVLTISMGGAVLSLFGPEFVVGWAPMTLLAVSLMLQIACGMLQSILIQGGKSTWQMYNKSIAVTLSVAGNLALVPVLGIWGAAITWLVVAVTDNMIAAVQVHRRMGVHLQPGRLVRAMLPPLVVFGLGGAVVSILWEPGPLPLLIAVAVLGSIYLAVLWILRRWLDIVPLWRKVPVLKRYA